MVEKYSKLKYATGAIIRRREDLDARVAQATKDLAQTEAELNVAVDTKQDDLAVVLIQKKNALTQTLSDLRGDLDTAQRDATAAKNSILSVQGEIKKLKEERDVMLARMQSAQARLRIQDQLEGLSVDNEVKALDTVREHIKNTIAQANLGDELSSSSLDSRLAALKTQAGDVEAKQQLAELRAKRAAQQAAAGQKTL
jgi:phage shock protein A